MHASLFNDADGTLRRPVPLGSAGGAAGAAFDPAAEGDAGAELYPEAGPAAAAGGAAVGGEAGGTFGPAAEGDAGAELYPEAGTAAAGGAAVGGAAGAAFDAVAAGDNAATEEWVDDGSAWGWFTQYKQRQRGLALGAAAAAATASGDSAEEEDSGSGDHVSDMSDYRSATSDDDSGSDHGSSSNEDTSSDDSSDNTSSDGSSSGGSGERGTGTSSGGGSGEGGTGTGSGGGSGEGGTGTGSGDDSGGGSDAGAARGGTAAWFKLRLDEPLYPGAELTQREFVFFMLSHKFNNQVGQKQFNELCRFLAMTVLPRGNLAPPSYELMRRIIDCPDWSDYEVHVCDRPNCKGHVWEHLPKKHWKDHADDLCPQCNQPRFVMSTVCGRPTRQPYQYYIDLLVEERIADFFNDPVWCKQRGKSRSLDPGSFWVSAEFTRLQAYATANGFQFDGNTSSYELMLDWLEPYNSVKYSVGVMAVRCTDIELRNQAKNYNTRLVAIFRGPKQPANLQPYIYRTIHKLRDLAHKGMTVTEKYGVRVGQQGQQQFEAETLPPGAPPAAAHPLPGAAPVVGAHPGPPTAAAAARTFLHRVILTGLLADTPARCAHTCSP